MSAPEHLRLRFGRICAEELSRFSKIDDGIGTYSEKRLHVALKRFISDDPDCYEKKIIAEEDGTPVQADSKKRGRRSCIADVLYGDTVYEIQTASLYPLKSKLEFLLNRTNHPVVIVHPLIAVKWVSWIDPASGEVSKRHRSPKKGNILSMARDLYAIKSFLGHERLRLLLPVIEAEEYRMLDGWGNGGKRGSSRFERYPISLIDIVELSSSDDYIEAFLPEHIPVSFTASEYARAMKIRGMAPYSLLSVLCELGAVRKGEKVGRSFIYHKSNK